MVFGPGPRGFAHTCRVAGAAVALLVACALPIVAVAHAPAASRLDWETKKELAGILGALPKAGVGLPNDLRGRRDVYVFVTAGSAYTKVSVLAPWIPPRRLAELLGEATKSTGLAAASPRYGYLPSYWAASVLITRPHYGRRVATNSVAVGRLASSVRSHGLTPYTLLRIPNYVHTPRLELPKQERRRYIWYNASRAREGFNVVVRASVPPALIVLLAYLRFFLPGVGVAGFVFGLAAGLSRRPGA